MTIDARQWSYLALMLLGAMGALPTANLALGEEFAVTSPNGRIEFALQEEAGRLSYAVRLNGKAAIEQSSLGITVDGQPATAQAQCEQLSCSKVEESYPWHGVHSRVVGVGNATTFEFRKRSVEIGCKLEVRAYDDGIAFRWIVPANNERGRVPSESTEFRPAEGSAVWYHDMQGHYEGVHKQERVADIPPDTWAAPPITLKLPEGAGYASITEASLLNYSGMSLQATGDGAFRIVLAEAHPVSRPFRLRYEEDIERLSLPAAIHGTIVTPWRVVMLGEDLHALVNADIIQTLSPTADPTLFPEGANTPWVRPGRAVWRYLDGGDQSLEGMKAFARQAGELGFEYNILEVFWEKYSDEEIRDLVEYSKAQGVGLWFWKHSKYLRTAEDREAFFGKLRDWGVVGAKIDFFDHEHKEVVDQYTDLLACAAKHKILINFHGANKPTGESRTWPNELVRESVKGMEARSIPGRARHDATLPFTRFLAGHADYTPTHFGSRREDTTWTHQIATAAVFTAPLLTYAAHPQSILENPAVDMIKSIPATWDETIVLPPSEIGEVAAFARRTSDTWFLAIVNGEHARQLKIPLSFLPNGRYTMLAVKDQQGNEAAVDISNAQHTRSNELTIRMSDGGGFIARFSPVAPIVTADIPHSDR